MKQISNKISKYFVILFPCNYAGNIRTSENRDALILNLIPITYSCIVGNQEVLLATIFTMLGTKNAYNSGKSSLALPLQHCNLLFFDIFEIGVSERVGKEVGFKHGIPCVFQSKIGALVSTTLSPPAAINSKSESVILSMIQVSLIQNKLSC